MKKIALRMLIATVLIVVCVVIGSLLAEFVIFRKPIGRAETWAASGVVGCVIGLAAFLLPVLFRWPLVHTALSLIPAECIMLYMIVSVSVGRFLPVTSEWWKYLFDFSPYSTYSWFAHLNMFLGLPWGIGIALAVPVAIFRNRKKEAANQASVARPAAGLAPSTPSLDGRDEMKMNRKTVRAPLRGQTVNSK